MNLYIENKSHNFLKKAYKSIVKNSRKEVNKIFIINYKKGFSKLDYKFFRKKGIYDIEYVLSNFKGVRKAIKSLNLSKNPISLTIIIKKNISENIKKILFEARKTIKIIDYTDDKNNLSFYKSNKNIIYKTKDEDTILDIDIMHIYKFYESELQCNFSSCLGKNLYVDRKGLVHFCPVYLEKSICGNITTNNKYFENTYFVEILKKAINKRNNCKNTCKYFEYCNGACPLTESCCGFPELFDKNSKYIDNVIKENKDLGNENLLISKIIIKDIAYEE